jgi:hypothetical protein
VQGCEDGLGLFGIQMVKIPKAQWKENSNSRNRITYEVRCLGQPMQLHVQMLLAVHLTFE